MDFVAGAIGGICGVAVGYPLDTVKVRIQTETKYMGIWHCVRELYRQERAGHPLKVSSGSSSEPHPEGGLGDSNQRELVRSQQESEWKRAHGASTGACRCPCAWRPWSPPCPSAPTTTAWRTSASCDMAAPTPSPPRLTSRSRAAPLAWWFSLHPLRWPRSACKRRHRCSNGVPRLRCPCRRPPSVPRPQHAWFLGPGIVGRCTAWPWWPERRACGASTRAAQPCSAGKAILLPPTSCPTPSFASGSPPLVTASQMWRECWWPVAVQGCWPGLWPPLWT
ncbi:solute carrier family 25 member 47 isoform X4 [Tamandua tetradactyla]|uniref:solute carrier family 25 member 47 isoform X4 n=1 Tax=Tamandua tetradactyla TaxID=48850 RepID=UPI004053DC72